MEILTHSPTSIQLLLSCLTEADARINLSADTYAYQTLPLPHLLPFVSRVMDYDTATGRIQD